MDAMSWSDVQYKQVAALPRLRITRTEEATRRDSITSSRTGDSGYISDPDISLSPLDFLHNENVFSPIANDLRASYEPDLLDVDTIVHIQQKIKGARPCHPALLKESSDSRLHCPKPVVTSNPGSAGDSSIKKKLNWTYAFKGLADDSIRTTSGSPPTSGLTKLTPKDDVELWVDKSFASHDRPKERVSSIVSLSSTGSGGDYSITDDSEAETVDDMTSEAFSKATLTTIELLMRKIELNLRHVAYIQCAGGQASRRQSAATSSRRGSVQGPGGTAKRKSRGDEGLQPDDQDEDGPTKRRRTSVTTTEDSDPGPRFACPFYKHDPNRYRNRRTCPGPGWPTVHRMKEHLYRSHAQPIFCPRCYTMFDSDSELAAHLRAHPCQMSAPQPIEGIDRETLINVRKRSTALRLEEDKWRDTYQLLFPEVPDSDIPSPYYDSDSPTESSRRFRRELLQRIRQELFTTAEQESGPVEQNLLRQVAGIIQRCETDLLNSFHGGASSPIPGVSQPQPQPYPHHDHLAPPFPVIERGHTHGPNTPQQQQHQPQQQQQQQQYIVDSMPQPQPQPPNQNQNQPQFQIPTWDDPPLWIPSNEYIDWNAVLNPGVGAGTEASERETNEPLPALSTPVWT